MLNYGTLENYYMTTFSLIQHHKYSLSEIETMIPFERDLYIKMLMNYLEEQEQKQKKSQ